MDFYLVRHGTARAEAEDPKRPLSDRGRWEVGEVARSAVAKGIQVSQILHSDKLRAKETAEMLGRSLSPAEGVRETRGLSPEDDPWIAKAELEAAERSLMLVGHLPHLAKLASLLVTGDPEGGVIEFSPAAIVCLSRAGGKWEVSWALAPLKT